MHHTVDLSIDSMIAIVQVVAVFLLGAARQASKQKRHELRELVELSVQLRALGRELHRLQVDAEKR